MRDIAVDEDVFAHLAKHAKPFVDTPNETLRRLLGLEKPMPVPKTSASPKALIAEPRPNAPTMRQKAPKTDLRTLIQAGILKEGDRFFLVNYQGERVPEVEATVSQGQLIYRGDRYAMSPLAAKLLQELGFSSNEVRGPRHWVNVKNVSIMTLWDEYCSKVKSRK